MLSISSPITSGAAVRYYVDLTNEDYLTQGGEPMGEWFGGSARKLDLIGKVVPEVLKNHMAGFSVDRSRKLVQNAGAPDRQRGWDLTFSAPKSVSVLWSQGDSHMRHQIEAAHSAAVRSALEYLEHNALWSRRGHAGMGRERVGMCAAIFQHGTSRAAQPSLHAHAVLASIAVREDGSTGSILSKPLFMHKMAAGALYRAALGAELIARLGLVLTQKEMRPFEVAGVVGSLVRAFSTRREQIERLLNERGESGPVAARRAALMSRLPKGNFVRQELFNAWEEVGHKLGWSTRQALALVGKRTPPVGPITARDLVSAVKHLSQFQAHFNERDLVRAVADQVQSKGYRVAQIESAVRGILPKLVPLGQLYGESQFTTKGTLRMEKAFLARIAEGVHSSRHLVSERAANKIIDSRTLSEEQKLAVKFITTTPGTVKVLSGFAGSGKTFVFDVARDIWENGGYTVVGASLTGKAAESLSRSAGIQSYTLASLLGQMNRPIISAAGVSLASTSKPIAPKAPAWSPLHGVRVPHLTVGIDRPGGVTPNRPLLTAAGVSLSATSRAIAPNAPAWSPLKGLSVPHLTFGVGGTGAGGKVIGPKTIVVVDEAGLVGTRQMADLVDRLTAARAKVVLVGDRKQNPPIEAGAPFRSLTTRIGQATLNDIQRQNEPWARQMVKDLASGDVRRAIDELNGRGRIHVLQNRQETVTRLVDDWRKAGPPRDNLILASTREDAAALNKAAQEKLAKSGELTGRPVEHRDQKFHAGDRVIFDANSRSLGVNNGTLGQVVRAHGDDLVVRLDSGTRVAVPLDKYPHVSLGYALTGHRAQGLTCENSFSFISNEFPGREMGYVQASRARAETHLYMDQGTAGKELKGLEGLLRPGRLKVMAHDILQGNTQEDPEKKHPAEPSRTGSSPTAEHSGPAGKDKVEAERKTRAAREEKARKEAKERDRKLKEEEKRREDERRQREENEKRQRLERERRQRENDRGHSR